MPPMAGTPAPRNIEPRSRSRSVVAVTAGEIAHDDAAAERSSRLVVGAVGPAVADVRIGERDDLTGVARVGDHLLVAAQHCVEHHLAGGDSARRIGARASPPRTRSRRQEPTPRYESPCSPLHPRPVCLRCFCIHSYIYAMDRILRPALAEMARRGTPFRGILYTGLMLTAEGAKLIEFDVRSRQSGVPALLPRLMSDLLPALQAASDGELKNFGSPVGRSPRSPW